MSLVDDYIAETQALENREKIIACLASRLSEEGFDNLVMARVENGDISELLASRLPDGYADTYLAENWAHIDPILSLSRRSPRGFTWNDALKRMRITAAQNAFVKDCADLGVRDGITIPLHGPGRFHDVVSYSMRAQNDIDPARTPALFALGVQTWVRLGELDQATVEADQERPVLTEREIEILRWCRDGKSYWAAGQIIGISEKTVAYHMANVFKKLGASNRTSAILIAIQQGAIEL
ncbi:MAG: LuxR family transcriptional regulator [Pseudomonadota bacterium]